MALTQGTLLLTRAVLRLERLREVFRIDDFPLPNRSYRNKLQSALIVGLWKFRRHPVGSIEDL